MQISLQVSCGCIAFLGLFRHAPGDCVQNLQRQSMPSLTAGHRLINVLEHHGNAVITLERRQPGEALVEETAKTIESVRPSAVLPTHCSGLMYITFPSAFPVCVSFCSPSMPVSFAKAGFTNVSGHIQAVVVDAINLVFTLIATAVIDRFGRKPLLLIGSVVTALCLFGVAAIFFLHAHESLLIWLLMAYIGFFAFWQGSVIWVYMSEIFPTTVRARAKPPKCNYFVDSCVFIQDFYDVLTTPTPSRRIVFRARCAT
jgi:hypothetical protein